MARSYALPRPRAPPSAIALSRDGLNHVRSDRHRSFHVMSRAGAARCERRLAEDPVRVLVLVEIVGGLSRLEPQAPPGVELLVGAVHEIEVLLAEELIAPHVRHESSSVASSSWRRIQAPSLPAMARRWRTTAWSDV